MMQMLTSAPDGKDPMDDITQQMMMREVQKSTQQDSGAMNMMFTDELLDLTAEDGNATAAISNDADDGAEGKLDEKRIQKDLRRSDDGANNS